MTPALQAVLAAGAYVGALLAAAWLARALYRAGRSIIYESPAGQAARAAGNGTTHVSAADNDAASACACAHAAGDTLPGAGPGATCACGRGEK